MSRDEVHFRDRLLLLAECSNPHKPLNVKRKSTISKQGSKSGPSGVGMGGGPKLSVQDFVRMDPGYTPDIEHLVFPGRKRPGGTVVGGVGGGNPQQVAPMMINPSSVGAAAGGQGSGKTRSRLAEMFALSRHLQQRSADRESKSTTRNPAIVNRSVDSVLGSSSRSSISGASMKGPLQAGGPKHQRSADGNIGGGGGSSSAARRLWASSSSCTTAAAAAAAAGGDSGEEQLVHHSRQQQQQQQQNNSNSSNNTCTTTSSSASASNRISPVADTDMAAASAGGGAGGGSSRGPNVSVLHLRSTSNPWDTSPTSVYSTSITSTRPYTSSSSTRSSGGGVNVSTNNVAPPPLTKHQSLGSSTSYKWTNSPNFHSGSDVNSADLFMSGTTCNRELSPVRWCDREVDGVYLGRSGWVQVQQRSLDENRRSSYVNAPMSSSLQNSRRTGIKLADYHCSNSEPGQQSPALTKTDKPVELQRRPSYLSLQTRDFERAKSITPPSPEIEPGESFSPPSLTPIISPPPAFQDRNKKSSKSSRSFFGKPPFLPRSPAIVDSDVSPPPSPPPVKWKSASMPVSSQYRKTKIETTAATTPLMPLPPPLVDHRNNFSRIPQTKSLEDTTASRRSHFVQRYGESSSSSSSSMGFRSLDSCVNRNVMPRLSENTDSSIDVYEDADEEDNNSSSLTLSIVSTTTSNTLTEFNNSTRAREKISPSGRSTKQPHHRTPPRRSPAGSDTNKAPSCNSPGSSSTSSNEFPSRSPVGTTQQNRRGVVAQNRQQYQQAAKTPQEEALLQRVRRSRSLQLPDRKVPNPNYREPSVQRVSPQHPEATHRGSGMTKMGSSTDRPSSAKRQTSGRPSESTINLDDEMMREAEVVTGYLYGSRTKAAAQALLMHRFNNNIPTKEEKPSNKDLPKPTNNGLTVYFVGNSSSTKERQKVLHRGATTPNLPAPNKHVFNPSSEATTTARNPCNSDTCDFWPHCAHRDNLSRGDAHSFIMRSSQSYPTHQRSLDSAGTDKSSGRPGAPSAEQYNKKIDGKVITSSRRSMERDYTMDRMSGEPRRPSPNKSSVVVSKRDSSEPSGNSSGAVYTNEISKKVSPVNPAVVAVFGNVSSSSSSSDVWLTTSDRTVSKSPKNAKSSGASTPMEEMVAVPSLTDGKCREMILTRPGSAPTEESRRAGTPGFLESQQRSMSLPKSFLSASYQQPSGQFPWRRRGTESLGSSPGLPRKVNSTETPHTAPVTPLHEGNRRRSPLGGAARRAKATSTPQLLDAPENRKWSEKGDHNTNESTRLNATGKDVNARRNLSGNAESVLQKFRKTFSLRFQKKSSKESVSSDLGDTLSEILGEPSEEESPQHVPSISATHQTEPKDEQQEQKSRFGPLIWRGSKERKKLNKAARSAKCNSGDSGIQIEMATSGGGGSGGASGGGGNISGGGGGGDSSAESHDTDNQQDFGDDLEEDNSCSPPSVRRRTPPPHGKAVSRPHSDLLNQILIDKFKSDLKQRAHHRHNQVRRTRSDLGGQRLLHWDSRLSYRRMMSSPAPLKGRPQSPRKKPPDTPGGVQLRSSHYHRKGGGLLRRSLSQPLDIDKLSPLMRTKAAGLRLGGSHVLSEDEHDLRIGPGIMGTSDDEAMSDSESSVASLSERKKSLELAMDEEMVILAEAVFDHVAIEQEELPFHAGDVIEVLETANRDWWWGSTNGRSGWFPAQFVRLRVSQEETVEDCLAAMASGRSISSQIRRRTSISLLSNDQVRTSVVRELVHTERDFVKVLQDVAEGYIAECRKRKDMFSDEQIATIFINLEDILKFQSQFLKDLEACINWELPYKSCVGSCFLKHRSGFKMYSEYCNSHPMATASLQGLYQFNNYSKFFEACRLMRGLIEIPLDGYLLTPVQRICKYPLQLAELLKYTRPDHGDYDDIKEALDAMRGVAVLINERKRRMESLEKLAAWQQRVEGWEGEDLIELSSQLIHQGEVVRVTTGMWTNNITLFLFDHQIVYCKKDILKRNTYVYKGRICLDTSEVIDVPDGKDNHLGVSVRHAIKLYSCVRDKWLLFCCRSSTDKQRWLQAFTEERRLVAQDKDDGLEFPPAARQLARVAARCQRRPPRKPRGGKNYKHDSAYMGSNLQLNNSNGQTNSNSLGRKMGTWFTFGVNKKSRHQSRDVS